MACKYKYNNNWYSKEELQSILYKERGIDKYGKLIKPEINTNNQKIKKYSLEVDAVKQGYFDTKDEAERVGKLAEQTGVDYLIKEVYVQQGIQPTQTASTLKESIDSVKNKVTKFKTSFDIQELSFQILEDVGDTGENDEKPFGLFINNTDVGGDISDYIQNFETEEQAEEWVEKNGNSYRDKYKEKEYISQALINTKIAALKEVAKKYPRSLIRSEVKPINNNQQDLGFAGDELPFQKIPINVEKLFEDEKFANEIYEALNFFDINIDGVAVNYNKDDFEKAAIKAYNEIIRDLNGEIAGLYDGTTIFVDDSLDNEEKLRVIKHEVAHSLYNEKSYIIEDLVSIINGKIEKDLIDNYYKPLVEERRAKKLGLNFEVNDLARMITNDPILSLKVKLFNENINAKEFIADILSRKSHRDFYFSNYPIETFNILNLIQHITPQQKQEAIHLYSQYLKQNPNGDIENFKSWIEEFKNKIYESLGYKVKQEFKSEPELLTVENETISGKENESFFEMQQTGIKNINIRKRIELAQQYNIIQGQSYSFFEIKKIFNNELLFNNDIYKQLEKILNSDLTFKFGSLNTGKKTINAYYNSNSNSINIDTLVLKTPNLAVSDFKRILLHEIIHAATFINLSENANLTITQKIALNNLNNVIEELNKDKDFFGQYGLKSANELLAELANDEFVKKLKNKKFDNNKNFFEKIISEIVKFLGLKTSAYDIVKESFDNLVKDYTDNQLTPQQKQEAIHLYSKYVELNPNGNIEEFKSWVNEFKQSTKVPFQITEKQKENIKPLSTDLIDYLNDLSTKSNKDILEEIKLNSSDEDLHKVIDVLVNNVGKIKFVRFKGLEPLEDNNNQAEYDGETGEIFVNSIAYQDGKVDVKDNLNRAIIHEYVHGFFLSVLKNPKTKQEKELVKYINEAYNTLISDYEDTDKWYGFTNVSEFVSELLSNKKFRESEQVKKTGIIQKIVNFINNLYSKKYGKTAVEIKENSFNKILDNIHILQPLLIDSNGRIGNSLIDFISQKSQEKKFEEKKVQIENEIKKLPIEIFNTIEIVDKVPLEILGRNDLYLSLKEILNEKNIKDELLINWLGIKKDTVISAKEVKSENHLLDLIKNIYDKKTDVKNHIELQSNQLASESFSKWVTALDKYPLPFKELMLSHAIKHLNPQRRSKYVLQLSEIALTNTFGMIMNKPYELNRVGKLYDQEVIKTVSDAVGHEPSASGKGYWVHIPRMEASNKNTDEYKKNRELLRKLSPSTWCTATTHTDFYLTKYDNYLLIVDGITVVGIEASKIGSNGKVQVKEVTSRNNNDIASIDHLEDTIAFFEKHNLDLNNSSIKSAIELKNSNITDSHFLRTVGYGYIDDSDVAGLNRNRDLEIENRIEEQIHQEIIQNEIEASTLNNLEDVWTFLKRGYLETSAFPSLQIQFRNNYEIAKFSVEDNPHSIIGVEEEAPFYLELAKIAVEKTPQVYTYLNEKAKENLNIKGIYENYTKKLEEQYIDLENINDDLPFSKTNENLIQGYYDVRNDKVVIVASNTPIEEAAKIAIHEVSHRGIISMMRLLDKATDEDINKMIKEGIIKKECK